MEASHSKRIKLTTQLERGDGSSSSGQPQRGARGFDGVILKVAEALSDDGDVRRLGLELGVKNPDINRALETNWAGGVKTSNGNVVMLQNWAMTVKSSKLLPTLRAALKKAVLLEVEETCFLSSPKGKHDVVQELKEKLKFRYREKYSKVKTSPIDPESRSWLQHIYVSLVLMIGSTQEEKKPIDYDGLFQFIETETAEGFATRLAFIGEAGVGKSTLFAKIALDWAEGKILQEIDLLLLESFREIEESKFFGDIVMNHFPDDAELKGVQVDEYIRQHQKKVLILLDGLDEAKIDITKSNHNSSMVSIIRREQFVDTPVLITTRPFGADNIKNIQKIRNHYKFIQVKGFTRKNMAKYIEQYFKDDRDSAATLIEFVKATDAVAKHMAPIPIFCCMLCYMWKKPSTRERVLKMVTLPQLLKDLVFSLQEHYSSKDGDVEGTYKDRMQNAGENMKEVGRVAFQGLLDKQLIFDEETIESEVGMIACEVGILTEEKRLAPMKHRERHKKLFIQEFSFPHKLLQEYTSSFYLASLFDDDRSEFNRILTDKLLKDYEGFRYVFYFTAARGGEIGKALMEALCQNVDDLDFIMGVAYECHDTEDTMEPVRTRLNMTSDLTLDMLDPDNHGYFFTLETLGKEIMRKESLAVEQSDSGISFESRASSSYTAAVGLFTMQNLQSLDMEDIEDEDFYKGMCNAASASKIQTLSIGRIHVTRRILHAILSLPRLQSFDLTYLWSVDADDEETLSLPSTSLIELEVDSKDVTGLWKLGLHTSCSQVRELTLQWGRNEDVSSDIVSMVCSPFKLLTELHVNGSEQGGTLEPVSFSNAVITSCPLLTKLYITYIPLYNEKAAEIIQSMKEHPHLTDIELDECCTNGDLDPLIAEVNCGGELTVTVRHGEWYS